MTPAFAAEQQALAASCWDLVGITDDVADDDAWIRGSLFGTDIFIQRFSDELRGFHNVCAHRGFPLRRAPSGVGPVRCGFHGWAYNRDGVPTTIPRNAELFGLSREQREQLALPAIRVEAIGRFVFATRGAPLPLAAYLGPHADVLRAASAATGAVILRDTRELRADWKLHAEISLDDYHLSSVHPTTFGAGDPPPLHQFVYRRDGLHSSYLKRRDPDWSFDGFWAEVATGVMDRTGYKIFNLFPGVILAATRDVIIASAIHALPGGRSSLDSFVFGWRADPPDDTATREIAAYFTTVFQEDADACERWQSGDPRPAAWGRLEERIRWFRAAYDQVVGRAGSPSGHA